MDDDDSYEDNSGNSTDEWMEMEAEHPLLMDKFYCGDYDDNDNKDITVGDSGGTLDADCDDVDDYDDNDSDRNNNNHEEQEESDATQQYPKRTREQVVNDRYILKQ